MIEEGEDECKLDCDELKVIDNTKSCSSDDDEEEDYEASEENKRTERVQSRLRKLIQCMQE